MGGRENDITIYQGDDFVKVLTLKVRNQGCLPSSTVINISGDTISGNIVDNFDCLNVLASFTCAVSNASGGQVTVSIPAAVTATLTPTNTVNAGQRLSYLGVYNLDWLSASTGLKQRVIEGKVYISRNANT